MTIKISLHSVMSSKKIRSNHLSELIDISETNLSLLKNGKIKFIKLETLNRLCGALNCHPGDILEFIPDETSNTSTTTDNSKHQ